MQEAFIGQERVRNLSPIGLHVNDQFSELKLGELQHEF